MREKILEAIYKKIEENPEDENLQKQVILLNKASISTIHSFCLDVIKNNFYEIDVSANTRIADDSEILLLQQEVIDDLFEEKYEEEDSNFIKLIKTYTKYNQDEVLKDLLLRVYSYIQASPFPEEWLEEQIEKLNIEDGTNFSDTVWGKIITENANQILEDSILKLQNIRTKMTCFPELDKFTAKIEDDIDKYTYIQNNLSDWDTAVEAINTLKNAMWTKDQKITNDLKDEAKDVRESTKDEFKKVKKLMNCSSEEAVQDIKYMYPILKMLKDLILEFSQKFYQRKREKNIMDFSDMEHLALKILVKKDENGNIVKSEIAKKYENKFEEIAIDEYQDSNLVQEYILTSVSRGNNIFMVGDVKQSIYKFRQARPKLFLDKYDSYKLDPVNGEDRKIQLFKNFRSRSNILDFTNLVFEDIMSRELGNIEYNQDEYLNLGANFEEIQNQDYKTELEILDLSEENDDIWKTDEEETEEEQEKVEDVVLEARFVARKIKELIDSKYQIIDKKTGRRDIQYKDIAILLRTSSGVANVYEKEISELEIPVYSDSSSQYLQSVEIETIMSLLRIINNPMQDIPLVTVMRSPIGNFTDNELIEIRMADRNSSFYEALLKSDLEKAHRFLNLLKELREDEEYMTLDEWIWNIYTKTGYMNYVNLMPNGALRVSNLRMLFERAKQYEEASFKGLYNFINFIDKIKFNQEDLKAAKIIGENENVVRIMTIHKSKGLEFPVVILAGVGKQFNFRDLNGKILLDQDLGMGPQYIDSDRYIEFKTLAKKALAIKAKNEAISEEMRILYVALTRAKEKLIIVGRQKDVNKKMSEKQKLLEIYSTIDGNKINPYLLQKYKTYLDWLELIYLKEGVANTKNLFTVNINKREKTSVKIENEVEDISKKIIEESNKNNDEQEKEKIKEILNWQYKHQSIEGIPTKTSVSKLKEKREQEVQITQEPKFINEEVKTKLTGAQKGTLIHLCLQKMKETEEYNLEKITELIEELKDKEIITEIEVQNIDKEKLLEYTNSQLWTELKQAKEIHKEHPFYINIKASRIYNQINKEDDEEILVQGVIDLFFIDKDDKLILVDYKTDYVQNENELVEEYKGQLDLYKEALEQSLDKKVDKMCIYSVYLNKLIEI
ncbi:aTP-dependent helicase/nuclease subunit A 2 [Clostridium sp. CAG:780]|nr:aTP-dependent helicase/nuclease subunit A 2 [Clostridium sp. CAG:780]